MKLSKFYLILVGGIFIIATITAQSSNLKPCCKEKGGVEFCCKKNTKENLPACCKAKGGAGQCCAKGKQNSSTAIVTNTTSNTQSLPACCANRANQKRSFWDKLFGKNKDLPACCANKK